jgi:hypothetical protein
LVLTAVECWHTLKGEVVRLVLVLKNEVYMVSRRNRYWGEEQAGPLLDYLNGPRRRLGKVEELLQANEAMLAGSNDAIRTIRKILERARLRPFFELPMVESEKGTRRSPIGHGRVPKLVTDRTRWVIHWLPARRKNQAKELAFAAMIDLGRMGMLLRVKRCPQCGRYYFQRMGKKAFCSYACNRKAYRSTPEWREKRRVYMRKERARERRRKDVGLVFVETKGGRT